MIETWRWFGPDDPISLEDIAQAGASGIVTALHDIPVGQTWSLDCIQERRSIIENAGLTWSVCESIPTPDAIKLKGRAAAEDIAVWKDTLANLGKSGIKTVCYNFMPVLDWTRTELRHRLPNGARALRFDWLELIAFDAYILRRKEALRDIPLDVAGMASELAVKFSDERLEDLERTILAGLPGGAEGLSKNAFLNIVSQFDGLTDDGMRQHLSEFLAEVCPVADEYGIKLAIHPDDPPFSIFGLPRIVSSQNDAEAILAMNSSPSNGLTFCTGSYGASPNNDLTSFVNAVKQRVYFAHLRNVKIEGYRTFHEADHLDGSANMIEIITELLSVDSAEYPIPFRPDHGHEIGPDLGRKGNPGYTYVGRLRGLAELRGIIATLIQQNRAA